jgi:hypothetical protein
MVIRAIQAGTWEQSLKPPEDRLVSDVQLEGDLWLLPVPAEVPLANQQARDEPPLDIGELVFLRRFHAHHCFTGEKNVKRRRFGVSALQPALLADRRDHQVPLGLIALAVRLDTTTLAQVLVDDPSLSRGHRVELDRAT